MKDRQKERARERQQMSMKEQQKSGQARVTKFDEFLKVPNIFQVLKKYYVWLKHRTLDALPLIH